MRISAKHGRAFLQESVRAAWPAALLSGLPSTIHALLLKRDPLQATIAAGSILLPREQRPGRLILAAIPTHLGLSVAWTAIMMAVLPRRHPVVEGTIAGLAIATIDLVIIGRLFPRIKELQPGPQLADHIAFGVVAATALARQPRLKIDPGDERPHPGG